MAAKDTKTPKKDEEAAEATAEVVKPKGKKKLLIIIVAVVVLLGGGAAAMLSGGGEKKKDPKQAEEALQKVFKQAKLETFIVNLSESTSFLKATIYLEYDPEIVSKIRVPGAAAGAKKAAGGDSTDVPEQIKPREAMIMDSIIRILSSKKAAEVLTSEGKQSLKDELVEGVNEAIGSDEPPIVGVYFKEFLIQ